MLSARICKTVKLNFSPLRFPRAVRRLLLGYLILHLLAAGFFVLVLARLVRNQMTRDAQATMNAMTTMLAEHIAADQQARVFERFHRIDKARSRDMGGTGLGLAIVKHLTQAFGGSVELESQIGKGSTFRIRLPRVLDSE